MILSIILLACEINAVVRWFEHSLTLLFFEIGVKTDLFQSCGHCWLFQVYWYNECSMLTASSFLLLNCMSCSHILEFKVLSVTLFPNIFSQSEGCLFILLIVSFAVQAPINLIKKLATVIRQGKKKIRNWKGREKVVIVCRWHIENPKDFTEKLLELINKFSKIAGYKINIQKSVAFQICSRWWSRRMWAPPVRIPKLHPAIEQPLTGGCWIPHTQKYNPCPRTKEKLQWDGKRGTSW